MLDNIGFMQGRLSPLVGGRIQAFPQQHWRDEFALANKLSLRKMEWTLDQEGLYANPLMTQAGREEIRALMQQHQLSIPSLTGDCFMQAPFYKAKSAALKTQLLNDFASIISACSELEIQFIVMPLVDDGRLENLTQENELLASLIEFVPLLSKHKVRIVFESDYAPAQLQLFIAKLDPQYFGVNYDTGNSAALGYDPNEEFSAYGDRIYNVHIKDRVLHGTTVPLGAGDTQFEKVFQQLKAINYRGNYILQTARAEDEKHAEVLAQYVKQTLQWLTVTDEQTVWT